MLAAEKQKSISVKLTSDLLADRLVFHAQSKAGAWQRRDTSSTFLGVKNNEAVSHLITNYSISSTCLLFSGAVTKENPSPVCRMHKNINHMC